MEEYLELIIKGSIVGALIGDALGYPYQEKINIKPALIDMIDGPIPAGTYTAKGAMLLCVLANINDNNGIDAEDLANKFYNMYVGGYLTVEGECDDIGLTSAQAIKNHSNGVPYDKCGLKLESYNDNEALIRAIPVGLYYANDNIDLLIKKAHDVSVISHGHVRSQVVSALFALITRNIFTQKNEKAFDLLDGYYKQQQQKDHETELAALKEWKIENALGGTKGLEDTFWSVWDSYSKYSDDYENCLKSAIAYGASTNVVASLAGALCGLNNGLNGIPQRWLDGLRLNDEVMITINEFLKQIESRLSENNSK
jgi:ADP-ribosylglycohydrolase